MNIDITPDAITSGNDNADHNRIYWFWEQSYYRLKYANTVLAYINVPKWDTTNAAQLAQRNALIGSAYFSGHIPIMYFVIVLGMCLMQVNCILLLS